MTSETDLVPVGQRWTALTLTRVGLAGAAVGAAALSPELVGSRYDAIETTALVYGAICIAIEAIRRRLGARALWLIGALIVLDGLFLARVVNATGGAVSPMNALVYLHIVAITLVISLRVGLEAAVWHAALVVITASGPGATMLESTLWSVPSGAALRATSYLVVAIAAAGYASVDERSLRRAQSRLAGEVDLLTSLEATQTVDATALVLGRHVVSSLGFDRVAVAVAADDLAKVTVLSNQEDELSHVVAEMPLAPQLAALELLSAEPTLIARLPDEATPTMRGLLPGAEDLVVVALMDDDRSFGAIIAEWPAGRRRTIPASAVDGLVQVARYGSMALRSSLLLAEVEARSRLDLLTGLGNRRAFDEALENELSRSQRAGTEASVVLLDLDRFKEINDSAGHQAGDDVLADVGRALVGAARPHDLVARIGGDEFAVLLSDCGLNAATAVAERARRAIADRVGDRGVTACAGVATAPGHGVRPRSLIRQADRALYRAKDEGRNRVMAAPGGAAGAVLDLTGDAAPQVLEEQPTG